MSAQLLRVSPITVRRYIASGRLAAERVGRGIRVRREVIEAFITPVVPASRETSADRMSDVEILRGSLRTSHDECGDDGALTDAELAWNEDEDGVCLDDELGEPFTMDDPL
jgi:excisionase family DNA binding protein